MVLLFAPYLFCMLMPMAVNAKQCGGTTGQRCNASLIYPVFKSVYLALTSADWTLGLCVRQEHLDNGTYYINYKSQNGTTELETTQTVAPTNEQDQVNITIVTDGERNYNVQVRYADYGICFVERFDSDFFGCRLWIYENTTSAQAATCEDGFKTVCPGKFYDNWDEEKCPGTA